MFKGNNVWYTVSEGIYEGSINGIIVGKNGMGKTYIKNLFQNEDETDNLFESEELFDQDQNLINSSMLIDFLKHNPINRIFIVIKYDRNATMKEWLKQYMLCFRNYKSNITVIVTFCPSEGMLNNWNEAQTGVLKFYGLQSLCMVVHVDQNVQQVNQALRYLMKQKQQILIDINQTKLNDVSYDIISTDLMQLQQLVGQIQKKGNQKRSKAQKQAQIYPEQLLEQSVYVEEQQIKLTQQYAKQVSYEQGKQIISSQVGEKKELKKCNVSLKKNQSSSLKKSQQSSQLVPPSNKTQKNQCKRECKCIIF